MVPPTPTGWQQNFEGTLAEAHRMTVWPVFEDGERIAPEEFDELLEVLYEYLSTNEIPPVDRPDNIISYLPGYRAGRGDFDTPFWNTKDGDNTEVCFDGLGCYNRSDVNYVAQGMWGAASDEGMSNTLQVVEMWNQGVGDYANRGYEYEHPASKGERFWTIYGYVWYLRKEGRFVENLSYPVPPVSPLAGTE
jgi:hypothetical protein